MDDPPRTNLDYCRPNILGITSSIVRPRVQANNFELKASVIKMVQDNAQFEGLQDEDPTTHIRLFLELCDTFKFNGVSKDAVRLRLFPFSLRGRAKQWLGNLPNESITTWDDLLMRFMDRYFPPSKTAKLRSEIHSFYQKDSETLFETWERFKELLRKCPHHGIPEWWQVQIFYNGLNYQTKQMINAAAGGSLKHKTLTESLLLFEDMAKDDYESSRTRGRERKTPGVMEMDVASTILSKIDALARQVNQMSTSHQQLAAVEPNYDGETGTAYVDYVGSSSHPQNNPYSNTYNPGWRNHLNFS